METALIICDAPKGRELYGDFLKSNGYEHVTVVDTPQSGRQAFIENEYDICIINSPLKSENAISLSVDIATGNYCQVILFVNEEIYEATVNAVAKYGVLTISKPFNRQFFLGALQMTRAINYRISVYNAKVKKLQKKMDENKRVSQAKCILIEKQNLSEQEAHRFIEKQAMNQRTTRLDIAESIIDYYN
ncbi:MAG: ANTAR domain-containing protein [Lachnospiraceae bacterium]|nr:ANTAR domain-containing protein [Lachnospiraceae bacterium]